MYKFFWGGVFSQWYSSIFLVDDVKFNCAEQYMMYQKALLFNDKEIANFILSEKSPAEQKSLGRKVKNFNLEQWNQKARDIVYVGNWHKFNQNKELWLKLKETGGSILVEASPFDKIWGIGLAENNLDSLDESKWKGKNWLGEVLVAVREDLNQNIFNHEHQWKIN